MVVTISISSAPGLLVDRPPPLQLGSVHVGTLGWFYGVIQTLIVLDNMIVNNLFFLMLMNDLGS